MGVEISWLNMGVAKGFVVCEPVVAGDKGCEGPVVRAHDFLVGGEQQHLVGSHWEIAIDEVAPV